MKNWQLERVERIFKEHETGLLYFYTPICGTCQMAGRMLDVVAKLFPNIQIGKIDLNYVPSLAERFEVQSVPCLLIIQKGKVVEKIFAFHSVPFLYEKIKETLL